MRTVLIAVYSYTGNSRRVAQVLAAQQGWPIGEVQERQPRAGAAGTSRCVLDSLLRRRPPARYTGPNPADFDLVVLVSPVWAYRLSGPMRTFACEWGRRLKAYAVMTTMGSRGAGNAEAELARITGRAPVMAAAVHARAVEDGSCAPMLQAFGDTLAGRPGAQPLRPSELSASAT